MEHIVKVLSEVPWCCVVPSELLACDTWTLKRNQKTCKKGHKIVYYGEGQKCPIKGVSVDCESCDGLTGVLSSGEDCVYISAYKEIQRASRS